MALGFEFQTNINVWKPGANLRAGLDASFTKDRKFWNTAFAKQVEAICERGKTLGQLQSHTKGAILIDDPTGWQLTADATDCEFITKPIPVDAGKTGADPGFPGEEQLIAQFDSMIGFCKRLDDFIKKRKTQWIYSEELEHVGFPVSVLFVQRNNPGDCNIRAFPQISGGLRLARLRKLFRHLARNSKSEAATLLLGDGLSQSYATTLGTVVDALKLADVEECVKAAGWRDHKPSAKLRGLLTLVAFYLRKGSGEYPAKVAKQFFYIMSRTDFSALFEQLDGTERRHYRDRSDEWVGLCCKHVYKKVSGAELDPNGKAIEQKITDYGALGTPIQIPVTRKQWLAGMTQGRDALCAAAHPKGAADEATYWDVNGNSRLRGLGGLGDTVDRIVTDDLSGRAPVFEFRGPTFSSARFDYTEWKDYARKCYRFLYAINVHEKMEKISEDAILSLSG